MKIKLADFGSGGVLDPKKLEEMGITRMGFTKTVLDISGTTSGTPLYLAPEVISGQPFTALADTYALGVMLYQMVVGDLHKPLAPGWERDIEDEFLREDIAAAADGSPAKRLSDASLLAQHLRTLEQRRIERAEQRAARDQAERTKELKQRYRRMRNTVGVSVVFAAMSLAAGTIAYKTRNDAIKARDEAQAVSQFLSKDVLKGLDINTGNMRNVTVEQWLDNAAALVDGRFAHKPGAAAQVHWSIGDAYANIGAGLKAKQSGRRALEIAQQHFDTDPDVAVELIAAHIGDNLQGFIRKEDLPFWNAVKAEALRRWGKSDARSLGLQVEFTRAMLRIGVGDRNQMIAESRGVLEHIRKAHPDDRPLLRTAIKYLSDELSVVGQHAEAELLLNQYFALEDPESASSPFGIIERGIEYASMNASLGRYSEAEAWIDKALQVAVERGSDSDLYAGILRLELVMVRLNQVEAEHRPAADVVPLAEQVYAHALKAYGPDDENMIGSTNNLIWAYRLVNRLDDAARLGE